MLWIGGNKQKIHWLWQHKIVNFVFPESYQQMYVSSTVWYDINSWPHKLISIFNNSFEEKYCMVGYTCVILKLVRNSEIRNNPTPLFPSYFLFHIDMFLAHLSWKLKWAFLITCRPSSLCLSVNFSNFHLLLQNHWANFNQTWHKVSLGEGDSSLFKWRATSFPKWR